MKISMQLQKVFDPRAMGCTDCVRRYTMDKLNNVDTKTTLNSNPQTEVKKDWKQDLKNRFHNLWHKIRNKLTSLNQKPKEKKGIRVFVWKHSAFALLAFVILWVMAQNGMLDGLPNIKWLIQVEGRILEWLIGLLRSLCEFLFGDMEAGNAFNDFFRYIFMGI